MTEIAPLGLTLKGERIEKPAVQDGMPVSYGLGIFKSTKLEPNTEDTTAQEGEITTLAARIIEQTPCKQGPTLFWRVEDELRSVTAVLFPPEADLIECMRFFVRCTSFTPEHIMEELLRVQDVRNALAAG